MADAPNYEIRLYTTVSGDSPARDLFEAMPERHAAKATKFFTLLRDEGPNLPRPYADALRGKIRELVVDIQHHGYRFLYFFAGRTIVITHGFLKKTPRTPPAEIDRAERYMADWLRRNEL